MNKVLCVCIQMSNLNLFNCVAIFNVLLIFDDQTTSI